MVYMCDEDKTIKSVPLNMIGKWKSNCALSVERIKKKKKKKIS